MRYLQILGYYPHQSKSEKLPIQGYFIMIKISIIWITENLLPQNHCYIGNPCLLKPESSPFPWECSSSLERLSMVKKNVIIMTSKFIAQNKKQTRSNFTWTFFLSADILTLIKSKLYFLHLKCKLKF